jgi:hypothetical protein
MIKEAVRTMATEARPGRSGLHALRRGRRLKSLVATAVCAGSVGVVAGRSSAAPGIPTVSAPFNVQRLPIFNEGSNAESPIRLLGGIHRAGHGGLHGRRG